MSDLFKIIQDPELSIPVAVPLNRAGSGFTIDEIYTSQQTGRSPRRPGLPGRGREIRPERTLGTKRPSQRSPTDPPSTVINVVENYNWTVSPKNNIIEQPYIYLTEFRLNKSPLLAQMVYLSKAALEGSGGAIRSVTDLFTGPELSFRNIVDSVRRGDAKTQIISGVLSRVVNKAGEFAEEGLQEAIFWIQELEDKLTGGAVSNEYTDSLQPYSGMYYRKKTGFEYKLPYFTNKMAERSSSWQKNYPGDTPLQELIKFGTDFVADFGAGEPIFGAYATPGIYIERSKYFNPTPDQDPLQFSFPLLNTLDQESMQRNFDLVWLLSFQNSSIRRNKVDVYPPCIYTAHIPGVRYMLYCNIQNLAIEYLGTRRRVSIIHPVTESELDVIVPEAYNLTFTINNLTTESGNLMLKSLTNV